MAYSDFNLSRVREVFGLVVEEPKSLFLTTLPTKASDYLTTSLDENLALATALNTEKARSEMIIAPVLLEVRRQLNFEIGFFSGTEFNIDPVYGLTGYCDYIRPLAELRLGWRNRGFSSRKPNFKVINSSNQITT